jgi:hypothetical protein
VKPNCCWKKKNYSIIKTNKINWMKRDEGYNRNTTKHLFSPISFQSWRERILCGTHSFLSLSPLFLFSTKQEKFTISLQLLSSFTLSSLFLPYQTDSEARDYLAGRAREVKNTKNILSTLLQIHIMKYIMCI